MNRHEISTCRIIKGKRTRQDHRYLVVTHSREVYISGEVPKGHQAIGRKAFETALTDAYSEHIRRFAHTSQNRNVYALSVYSDDRHTFQLCFNTLEGLERTITESPHYSKYTQEQKRDLKYSLGDFAFSYASFTGPFASQYAAYHDVVKAEAVSGGFDAVEVYRGSPDHVRYVYAAELFGGGQYITALQVTKRLTAQSVWLLQTTPDFVAFASSGSEYVDYSVAMRQTIETQRFYSVFPEMRIHDEVFQAAVQKISRCSYSEQVSFWYECVRENRDRNPEGLLTSTVRTDYQAVEALADSGADIVPEILRQLRESVQRADEEKAAFLCEVLLEFDSFGREAPGEMEAVLAYVPSGNTVLRALLTETRHEILRRMKGAGTKR
ncbi:MULTISPECIES: DUF4303 domain-containing protein [Paenibacillus]|uniref:DUF4303 domain-containing protein n=1 Tax=Paenibacillus TaxID=44249 RepID=UPI0022B89230|nr:DUF4303 domain-containing protein [Paenibacillus caseinilyticus]MCZ8523971.1 DUF4303 domain-containing protein [Paenibacillus caseinilyticus]